MVKEQFARMPAQNPLRMNCYRKYSEIAFTNLAPEFPSFPAPASFPCYYRRRDHAPIPHTAGLPRILPANCRTNCKTKP
jgi:hypothetical protein